KKKKREYDEGCISPITNMKRKKNYNKKVDQIKTTRNKINNFFKFGQFLYFLAWVFWSLFCCSHNKYLGVFGKESATAASGCFKLNFFYRSKIFVSKKLKHVQTCRGVVSLIFVDAACLRFVQDSSNVFAQPKPYNSDLRQVKFAKTKYYGICKVMFIGFGSLSNGEIIGLDCDIGGPMEVMEL
ncbi:hypothetical protein RFI_38530, partial [Reticulomyxa filosa]